MLHVDRNCGKSNFDFLMSLKFPREQELVRTEYKHKVFLTAGQQCEPSLWSPFHRTEAKESPSYFQTDLGMVNPLQEELFSPESLCV